ncbi:MAG TPA: hypothetical protein VGR60_10195, partial [Gemmatimonadales bacterium]|nr:hypothetical protein [Gemmatimonadales bacterium]
GPLLVVTSTASRSVVAFVGAPYSLTRGDTLALVLHHSALAVAAAPRPSVEAPLPGAAAPPAARRRSALRSDGSLSLDLDLMQTRTTGLGVAPEQVTRNFTTPSIGLRYRLQGMPGGWELSTSIRATQRSSTGGVVDPATLVQVYEAAVVRRTRTSEVRLGRFFDPYESFSGYWDGVMLHRGTDALGVGVLAGFEPDRGNGGFQSTDPKVGAVLHARTGGAGVRYRSALSVNLVFPSGAGSTHAIVGVTQGIQLRAFTVSGDLQVDRNPVTTHWVVTRLLGRMSTRLGQSGTIYAGYAIRQPYVDWTVVTVIPYRRDQVNAGFTLWSANGGVSADVSSSQQEGSATQWAYTASGSWRSRTLTATGAGLSTTYWTDHASSGLLFSPSLLRRVGSADLDLVYQYYLSDVAGAHSVSHGIEFGARLPLAARTQLSLRARERLGGYLQSSGIYAGLWYGF